MFVCKEYNQKSWCGLEWRAIRTLLHDKDSENRIMFVKCGLGEVDGVFGTIDGMLDAVEMTPSEIATCIIERYNIEYGI